MKYQPFLEVIDKEAAVCCRISDALWDDPSLIEKAKAEHKEKVGAGYVCGLPNDMKPDISK